MTQCTGVLTTFVWTFGTCFLLFKLIALTIGLRVSPEEELAGLDLAEHSANSYPDFMMSGLSGGLAAPGTVAPPRDIMLGRDQIALPVPDSGIDR